MTHHFGELATLCPNSEAAAFEQQVAFLAVSLSLAYKEDRGATVLNGIRAQVEKLGIELPS